MLHQRSLPSILLFPSLTPSLHLKTYLISHSYTYVLEKNILLAPHPPEVTHKGETNMCYLIVSLPNILVTNSPKSPAFLLKLLHVALPPQQSTCNYSELHFIRLKVLSPIIGTLTLPHHILEFKICRKKSLDFCSFISYFYLVSFPIAPSNFLNNNL